VTALAPSPVVPQAVKREDGPSTERGFDGIICFGGVDWWYHNRGHYDLQMMREFSATMPVLYINSIGMRTHRPSEGAMYLRRIARKLKSIRRGLVRPRENFGVFSPLAAPGPVGRVVSGRVLPWQVNRAARAMGVRRPLVWVACPPAARFLGDIPAAGLVYQRTDRFEAFGGVDPDRIRKYDRELKERADLTLFCSRALYEDEQCRRAVYVDHGVDFERFAEAGDSPTIPQDVQSIPGPRVGFVGGVDSHTFDSALFIEVARRVPQAQFMVVGSCSLPAGWCDLPNVHLLGQRPYDQVPGYMAACDVLIMPWNRSDWIKACNPVKLKEYLAVGRPVVSTEFDELARYPGLVRSARTAEEFAAEVARLLQVMHDASAGRERVRSQTWSVKAATVLSELRNAGLAVRRGPDA
jgi:glycosyltransferase involved in cell wall biosynthesis